MRIILILSLIQILFCRELDVQFYSENDWLYGRSWPEGTTFYNGIAYGSGLVGQSTLSEEDMINVDIHFSLDHDSTSVSPVYSVIDTSFIGLGIFPGIALDVSDSENPRRINLAFFEDGLDNLYNFQASTLEDI